MTVSFYFVALARIHFPRMDSPNWLDNFDFKSLTTPEMADVMRHLTAESKFRTDSLMAAISTLHQISQSQEAHQERINQLAQELAAAIEQTSALARRVAWLELLMGQTGTPGKEKAQ